MSNYEFWKDLGKIFNAVVAYQEKSIEFNKRFINPWIKIGNVFDTQDRHREAVRAYQQAVDLDPGNAQTWLELGNAHFRNEAFDEAVTAFQKAIELNPNLGWPYSNLALTYVVQSRHAEARLLFEKSITLLEDDKDKAISWNRLGNLHRKLNEYDLAMLAFQKADELDKENTGFKDEFDEVLARVDGTRDDETAPEDMIANSIQLIVEQNQTEEKVPVGLQETPAEALAESIQPPVVKLDTAAEEMKMEEPGNITSEPQSTELPIIESRSAPEVADLLGEENKPAVEDVLPLDGQVVSANLVVPTPPSDTDKFDTPETVEVPVPAEKTETVLTENVTETYTESLMGMESVTETFHSKLPEAIDVSDTVPPAQEIPELDRADEQVLNSDEKTTDPVTKVLSINENIVETTLEVVDAGEKVSEPTPEIMEVVEKVNEAVIELVDAGEKVTEPAAEVPSTDEEAAEPTREVLIDKVEEPVIAGIPSEVPVETNAVSEKEAAPEINIQIKSIPEMNNVGTNIKENDAEIQPVFMMDEVGLNATGIDTLTPSSLDEEMITSHEPIAMVDETGGFQLEMDTKNAHVWNELGNVYFNRGAIDDAIVAYSKAIELDRWFAWPYSNLALAYVQKERFAEAMLLYQRSIELFAGNKDKAISWNRLGNVYRRLNDYDNAIASYQRADELDPDNSTIYQQSRFSLLGNYQVELNTSLSS